MLDERLSHGAVTSLLAMAIDAKRIDRVVLAIRPLLAAVKNVIRRYVDQRNAGRPANISYSTHPNANISARRSAECPLACSGDM